MIGVVADDITGSNDIGIMFAKSNFHTNIYTFDKGNRELKLDNKPDVVILDTDSRFDTYQEAYSKVYHATKLLKARGVSKFFNKTCSVFRGNIGAEFDAMLDALEEDFAVIVLGFPKNGRKTCESIHYVHGKRLGESEFRNDPMHPMCESNLINILQSQTERKVAAVTKEIVKQGAEVLRAKIKEMESRCNYLVLDVLDQNDLGIIAECVYDYKIFCGSSALAEELPKTWGIKNEEEEESGVLRNQETGIICAAGSLMPQTATQIEYFREKNNPVYEIDTLKLFDEKERNKLINGLVAKISTHLEIGDDVLFHSSNDDEKVQLTREVGVQMGYKKKEISRLVSGTIAEITHQLVKKTGQNRLLIAGGDTSAAVCKKLGINGMRVWKEIKPGLPSCISLTENPIMLVLKSGSFGEKDFFELAIEHLRNE